MQAEPEMGCDSKEKPPIEQEIEAALKGLERLEGVVADLVEKLEPVTNEIPAVDEPKSDQPESAGSSKVYHALEQINARIRKVTKSLAYLERSLEV